MKKNVLEIQWQSNWDESEKADWIPKSSSNNLLNSCPDKISHQEIRSADHDIIHCFDEYFQAINDFVNAPDLIVNPKQ